MEMALSRLRGPVKEISKSHAPSFLRARFLSSSSSSSRSLSRYTLSLSLSWNLFFIYFGRFGLVKCCWGLLHMIELVIDVNLLLVCGKCCVLCWKLWVWLIATIGQFFYFILMFCKFYLVNFCAAASFGIN